LQAAIGVFLGDGDHEAEVGLDHFLLGDARFALALLDGLDQHAIIVDRNADFLGDFRNLVAHFLDFVVLALDEAFPLCRQAFDAIAPFGLEFVAEIVLEEFLARHAMGIRHAHQLAFKAHQLLVDRVKLLNQRLDTGIVDVDRLQALDNVVRQLVIFGLGLRRQVLAFKAASDKFVLQLAIASEPVGDLVKLGQNAVTQFRFHGRHGHRGGVILVVLIIVGGFAVFGFGFIRLVLFFLGLGFRRRVFRAVCGLKVDQVAQQDALVHQLVAPHHHGFEGQRAFAKPADHRVAARFDALGNRDLAFTREQFDGAHFAQVHAHGVVSAVRAARVALLGDNFLVFNLGKRLAFGFGLFLALDDRDAHFRDLGHHILDLVGGHLVIRKQGVDFVMRDEAALLRPLQNLFDIGCIEIDNGGFAVLLVITVTIACGILLLGGCCHSNISHGNIRRCPGG